jgi:CRP/FNR family cyclic AMP-dependent transcriptional regulator
MQTLDDLLAESPVFGGLTAAQLALIAGCGRNVAYEAGNVLFREGDPADTFFLLRRGRVMLSTHLPARGDIAIDTIEPGDVLGWSWLHEPHRWHFDAVASEDCGAVVFDGVCLRGKCDDDHELGYALLNRFAQVMIDRLQHTRLRLLDVYGSAASS